MSDDSGQRRTQTAERERWALLREVNEVTATPLVVLSFVWLVLLVLDLITGLQGWALVLVYVIWGLFIADFVIGFLIAPRRAVYLRTNWLTAISLMIPALRILRVFQALRVLRAARAARSINLARTLTATRRGVRAARIALGRRGFAYVVVATVLVIFIGAAGMTQFESPGSVRDAGHDEAQGIESYGEALWWTSMIITTLGSDYWPVTPEGRFLTVLLSVYSVAIFGYITATLASIFVSGDVGEGVRQSRRQVRATTRGRR